MRASPVHPCVKQFFFVILVFPPDDKRSRFLPASILIYRAKIADKEYR
jgi:hypothetical protein